MDSPAPPSDQVRHTQVCGGEIPVFEHLEHHEKRPFKGMKTRPCKGMKTTDKNVPRCGRKHRADRKHENIQTIGNSWQVPGTRPHTDNDGTYRMHDVLVQLPVTAEGVVEFRERVSRQLACITDYSMLTLASVVVFIFINLLTTFLCIRSCAFLFVAKSPNRNV